MLHTVSNKAEGLHGNEATVSEVSNLIPRPLTFADLYTSLHTNKFDGNSCHG